MSTDGFQLTVLGVGLMGQGIAAAFAARGVDVRVWDTPDRVEASAEAAARRRDTVPDVAVPGKIAAIADLRDAISGSRLMIEALPEDVELKRSLLGRADELAPADTIFCSNTSSIPLTDLRAGIRDARNLVATHFFNPAEIAPGVEVAVARQEDDAAAEEVMSAISRIGKRPTLVSGTTAFIGNRLQAALFREAVMCVEEGVATAAQIDDVFRSTVGFRLPVFGPFGIADMAGLHIFAAILENLERTYGQRFSVPASLAEHVHRGERGLSTGRGYLDHPAGDVSAFLHERDEHYRAVLAAAEFSKASDPGRRLR